MCEGARTKRDKHRHKSEHEHRVSLDLLSVRYYTGFALWLCVFGGGVVIQIYLLVSLSILGWDDDEENFPPRFCPVLCRTVGAVLFARELEGKEREREEEGLRCF